MESTLLFDKNKYLTSKIIDVLFNMGLTRTAFMKSLIPKQRNVYSGPKRSIVFVIGPRSLCRCGAPMIVSKKVTRCVQNYVGKWRK